jgi:hypothetical protein
MNLISHSRSDQVDDFNIPPLPLQIFRHKPAVAEVRFFFTAQETSPGNEAAVKVLLDAPFLHQSQEGAFVFRPCAFVPFIPGEQFLAGREQRQVYGAEINLAGFAEIN